MRWLALGGAILWFLLMVRPIQAAPRLRALLANPAGSDNTEWILLENDSTSSWSGQISLKDTNGASVTYTDTVILNGMEFLELSRSATNISLNNDQDGVVLTVSGQATESSELYSTMLDDEVWWRDSTDVWRRESLISFRERQVQRQWEMLSEVNQQNDDEATSAIAPSLAPTSTPVKLDASLSVATPLPIFSPLTIVKLNKVSHASNSAIVQTNLPLPPLPDTEGELNKFYKWRKGAIWGALLILWSGGVWLLLSWQIAQNAYNEETWIAPLPSSSARSPPSSP